MAKQTKQQRIEELEEAIDQITKKVNRGLMTQVKRKDRDPVKVALTSGNNILTICNDVMGVEQQCTC